MWCHPGTSSPSLGEESNWKKDVTAWGAVRKRKREAICFTSAFYSSSTALFIPPIQRYRWNLYEEERCWNIVHGRSRVWKRYPFKAKLSRLDRHKSTSHSRRGGGGVPEAGLSLDLPELIPDLLCENGIIDSCSPLYSVSRDGNSLALSGGIIHLLSLSVGNSPPRLHLKGRIVIKGIFYGLTKWNPLNA